ncbi:MAG: RMD1 family protein [Gammaproteobacteria bacterium]|nr:RMD1 family protein [Gammaproteobacteria bacterium]
MKEFVNHLNDIGLEPKYFDDVVHVQKDNKSVDGQIDIFFFPFGCVTIWGADEMQERAITHEIEKYSIDKSIAPTNDFIYYKRDSSAPRTYINEEKNEIILNDDSVFIKLSISHALAQSVKLNLLEQSIASLLEQTSPLQKELASTGGVSLSKKQISKQIGILFNERYSVNLHSDILDTPEFFWRRPSFEPLYLMTAEFQDIQLRQSILNHRLDMIHELYHMLSNELNYKHSTRLELIIIVLIAIEVAFSLTNSAVIGGLLHAFS